MSDAEPQTPGISAASGRRILIVEDEFLIRLTLSEVLTDEGYEVLEADNGQDALLLLQNEAGISVLLTDIQLPGLIDGKELVSRMRTSHPDLPVIFMTGRPDVMGEQAPSARELYVAKPYLPSEICTAVRRMLAE